MKFLFQLAIVFSLLGIYQNALGQEEPSTEIFTIVEQMPQYPGGDAAMFKFLGENINYPDKAKDEGISGVVYVTFVVDSDGEITNVKVIRGIGGGCDEEAVRVVKAMPDWEPGRQKGKKVSVQYNLPIRFALSGKGTKK